MDFINWVLNLYQQHPFIAGSVSMLFVSSAVGALPSPTFTSSGFYVWFFGFIHTFTGGLFRVIATRNPSFQAQTGAQPYRPENANGSTAKEIKQNLQQQDDVKNAWKPKGAK